MTYKQRYESACCYALSLTAEYNKLLEENRQLRFLLTGDTAGGIIEERKKSNYIQLKNGKMNGSRPLDNIDEDDITDTTNAFGNPITIVKRNELKGPPNGITQTVNSKGGITRNYYDENGNQKKQISNNDHGHKVESQFGNHGEHAHDYNKDSNGKFVHGKARELTNLEREENADIL